MWRVSLGGSCRLLVLAAAQCSFLHPPSHPAGPAPPFPPCCADGDDLAAACGMFVSPAKGGAGGAPVNKPRKLFLEEEAAKAGGERPAALGDALPPALWVQAA